MLLEPMYDQGHIEPPKVARGRATYIDGKMLSVTKYSFQMYFQYVNYVILVPDFLLKWLRPRL